MEGNLSTGVMPGGGNYRGVNLKGSMADHHHHHQQRVHGPLHQQLHSQTAQGSSIYHTAYEKLPLTIGNLHDRNHNISLFERGKSVSEEEEPSFTEDAADPQGELNRGKKSLAWQRVKWTDQMVRLLITAVSYLGEEAAADCSGESRRKYVNLHKKGKWKIISTVMAERGYLVSPQQCEDKFNDLNKRYKRLNEILGRGTSCEVVENPELLNVMDHISEKAKEEVRKILSSKHLHYEEMCSYHNRNRLHLPPDPELQRSLQMALRYRDDQGDHDVRRQPQDDNEEDDHDAELDGHDENEQNPTLLGDHIDFGGSAKRIKQSFGYEDVGLGNSSCNIALTSLPQNATGDASNVLTGFKKKDFQQQQWMNHHFLQLEEKKLEIKAQMLELEKEKSKWQRFSWKQDRELEMMRIQNEKLRLENEHMALELKRKGMDAYNI